MNNGNQGIEVVYLIVMAVFVVSALFGRGIAMRQWVRMLLGWIAIFSVVFVLFAFRDDIMRFGGALIDRRGAESTGLQVGEELHIEQALDGHYWVEGKLNGADVRFLIDSGATTTSISGETARRAGIEPGGLPAIVQTANGVVTVARGRAERLQVGHIVREDMAVHISDGFGETNVLGMNFLSSLSGWGVEDNRFILKP